MTSLITRQYQFLFEELSDPRVRNWTFMSNPLSVIFLITTYLVTIIYLPKHMKNKKPYSLKNVIFYYNVFQIMACAILIYGLITNGWITDYTFGCEHTDYTSNKPIAIATLTFIYYTLLLKMIELIETIFFILRKKNNQVTFLHVYHHCTTLCIAWVSCKYIGGAMSSLHIIINCFIHILMYTYYLLASLGPKWQQKLSSFKPKLTMLQMVQFCIMLIHSSQALRENCKIPKWVPIIYIPNIFVFFYMFWNFYKTNYFKKHI